MMEPAVPRVWSTVVLSAVRIGVRGALLVTVLGVTVGCSDDAPTSPAPRPNVLLISLDTLRADHVGSYGYRLATTPALDALAAKGVRFADVTVPTPKTWPAVATLLTGASPRTTGVRLQNRQLRDDLPVLAEVFAAAGYRTAGIVTNFNLLARFGFGRGFETYVEAWDEAWGNLHPGQPLPEDPKEKLGMLFSLGGMDALFQATDAKLVTDRALEWLQPEGGSEQPFFLWLHYMDPHGPYDPPPAYSKLFDGQYPEELVPVDELRSPHLHTPKGSRTPVNDLGFYKARYDREIRSMDDQLARLFQHLEQTGLAPNTLVVVTADHGEALGTHGYYFEHGLQPYQECASVPLIVSRTGTLPAGLTVEAPVGLIDLPPTVLELAGLPIPETFEGQSLATLARGDRGATAPANVFMESGDDRFVERPMQLSVRQGPWKLVLVSDAASRKQLTGSTLELYDLASDPDELLNRAADPERAAIVGKLLHELRTWDAAHPVGEQMSQEEFEDGLDPNLRRALEEMGYLGGGSAENEDGNDDG
jgi:arylsulfatase A-like enzyme